MRWGITGYGWVAQDFMRPAIEAAGGTLVGIADVSETARERARGDGFATYEDTAALLGAERPDILYIATPNHRHIEPVQAAAEAGVAVLCEKPIAESGPAVERIAAVVRHANIPFAAAFDQRHHPAHVKMADMIANDAIGTQTAVRIVYCCWVGPGWSMGTGDNWRANPVAAGGGATVDLAPHGLDLAERLVGEEVEALSITLQRRVHDYAVDDGGIVAGRTASGALFSAHVAYNCPEDLPRRRLEVVGSRGALVAENTMGQDAGGSLTWLHGGESEHMHFDRQLTPFAAQATAFQDYVRTGNGDFDAERDIASARRFFTAYEEARSCL
ncbi:MAG: Gfo/Idh/MocA family oxidoreductase [Pacificimonas sp.]